MPDIKLVTFDLDNTLWNVETVIRNAEQRMRDWLHEQVPDFPIRFPPEALAELRNAVLEESPKLRHDLSTLREQTIYRAILGCGFSRHDARKMAHQAFHIFLDARHDVEYFDGALEILEALARRYVLGALTNGNADIRRLKLDRFFHFGYSSETVGVSKPDPAMFDAALRHAGTAPEQAVHVGDHLVDDVEGASRLGIHTIWVNQAGLALPEDAIVVPDHTVQTLTDVPAVIEEIPGRH